MSDKETRAAAERMTARNGQMVVSSLTDPSAPQFQVVQPVTPRARSKTRLRRARKR